jgi:uncharacterized protein YyaL (SSP411 family)
VNTNPKYTNALIHSSSPYLLQHAHNPVNWEEWHPELWEQAKQKDRLVLISIGYSACHWCHVMERESFEDEQTAALMNSIFINIKVDREERPDVDMVYMDACQLMTGRGGWPLNVICLPDGRPVYAGTYFPNENWQQAILQLQALWQTDKAKADEYANKVFQGISQMNAVHLEPSQTFSKSSIGALYQQLSEGFDWEEGGANRVPKFPLPNQYEWLLDYHLQTADEEAKDFVNLSLLKMANGGIYDHLRGGFCRYSTDGHWFAPHFEKMLYDNAQLISLYSRAFGITDAPLYREIVQDTIRFCNTELSDGVAYYSALDADSEGIEGRYYVFTHQELSQCLNEEELTFAETLFSCTETGNWEHGYNILLRKLAPLQVLQTLNIDVTSYTVLLKTVKSKLLAFQQQRPRPGLDYKIITAWNGLMLKALSDAGTYLNDKSYIRQAETLANWMKTQLWHDGQLYRIYSLNKKSVNGFLEDYACYAEGLLALFSATGKEEYASFAMELTEAAIKRFRDPETGIFYFSPNDGEALLLRKTDLGDDVINSASSVMAHVLCKIGTIYQRPGMMRMGYQMLDAARTQLKAHPGWYSNWGRLALAESTGFIQISCTGHGAGNAARQLLKTTPAHAQISFAETNSTLPQFQSKIGDSLKIYICLGETCLEPVNSVEQAVEIIQDLTGPDH